MDFNYNDFISPCIDLCQLDADKKYCIGCKRSIEEIKNWKHYTKEEKLAIMKQLKQR